MLILLFEKPLDLQIFHLFCSNSETRPSRVVADFLYFTFPLSFSRCLWLPHMRTVWRDVLSLCSPSETLPPPSAEPAATRCCCSFETRDSPPQAFSSPFSGLTLLACCYFQCCFLYSCLLLIVVPPRLETLPLRRSALRSGLTLLASWFVSFYIAVSCLSETWDSCSSGIQLSVLWGFTSQSNVLNFPRWFLVGCSFCCRCLLLVVIASSPKLQASSSLPSSPLSHTRAIIH